MKKCAEFKNASIGTKLDLPAASCGLVNYFEGKPIVYNSSPSYKLCNLATVTIKKNSVGFFCIISRISVILEHEENDETQVQTENKHLMNI